MKSDHKQVSPRAGHWRRPAIAISALALAAAATISAPAVLGTVPAREAAPASAGAASTIPASFADLAAAARPAVVNISVTAPAEGGAAYGGPFPPSDPRFQEFFQRFFGEVPNAPPPAGPMPSVRSVGSGFIIDAAGYIVTNNHVVKGAAEISVTLDGGRRYPAKLIGADEKTDLALLKIEAEKPLATVAFGDSDRARVGDWVVAVGNPFGLGGTFTAGIVSARGRDIQSGPFDDFLQIDAPINRGNSGGPLFNVRGEVIGVNTAIFSPTGGSVGIGFAVPSDLVKPVIEQLRAQGRVERGWLGVQIQSVSPDIAEALGLPASKGALVADVLSDSPAARAGVEVGDVIVAVDGETVSRLKDLPRLIGGMKEGTRTSIDVIRNGDKRSLTAKLGSSPALERQARASGTEPGAAPAGLGLAAATASPEVRARFGLADDVTGAVVTHVAPGSPAAVKQLRPGDVIVMVGGTRIDSAPALAREVRAASGQGEKSVLLLVDRAGNQRFLALPLAKA